MGRLSGSTAPALSALGVAGGSSWVAGAGGTGASGAGLTPLAGQEPALGTPAGAGLLPPFPHPVQVKLEPGNSNLHVTGLQQQQQQQQQQRDAPPPQQPADGWAAATGDGPGLQHVSRGVGLGTGPLAGTSSEAMRMLLQPWALSMPPPPDASTAPASGAAGQGLLPAPEAGAAPAAAAAGGGQEGDGGSSSGEQGSAATRWPPEKLRALQVRRLAVGGRYQGAGQGAGTCSRDCTLTTKAAHLACFSTQLCMSAQ
jgi:hypothetical protein